MIKLYVSPNCSSCKKVKQYFDDNKICYEEKNIFTAVLNPNELKDMLVKSENGTDDIISKRSNIIKEGNVDIDSLTINELIKFIKDNPSILKRPIIVDDDRIKVGFNKDEISSYVQYAKIIAKNSCTHSPNCGNCPNSVKNCQN